MARAPIRFFINPSVALFLISIEIPLAAWSTATVEGLSFIVAVTGADGIVCGAGTGNSTKLPEVVCFYESSVYCWLDGCKK